LKQYCDYFDLAQYQGVSLKWENPTLLPGLTTGPCLSASVPACKNKHHCKNITIFNTKHKKMKKMKKTTTYRLTQCQLINDFQQIKHKQ